MRISVDQCGITGKILHSDDSERVLCDDPAPSLRELLPIFCELARTGGMPGGLYFICDVLWNNDGSPATIPCGW